MEFKQYAFRLHLSILLHGFGYNPEVKGRKEINSLNFYVGSIAYGFNFVLRMSKVIDSNETNAFNTEAHIELFKETFKLYGQDLNKWLICYIPDDAADNNRIAYFLTSLMYLARLTG